MAIFLKENLSLIKFKVESTAGTYNAPLAADNDLELHYSGLMSNETASETIGMLQDGTFREGESYTRERVLALPEITVPMRKSDVNTTSPLWTKLALSGGYNDYTAPTTLEKGISWTGQPSCQRLSATVELFDCGNTPEGKLWKLRGLAGNMEIKTEQAQGPIVLAFSNMKGAWDGVVDRAAAVVDPIVGNDTAFAEQIGNYAMTIGGDAVDLWAYSFTPNADVNMIPASNEQGIAYMDIQPSGGGTLKLTVPQYLVSVKDIETEYFEGVIQDIILTGNANAGFSVSHTACNYKNLQYTSVNGIAAFELEFNVQDQVIWAQV